MPSSAANATISGHPRQQDDSASGPARFVGCVFNIDLPHILLTPLKIRSKTSYVDYVKTVRRGRLGTLRLIKLFGRHPLTQPPIASLPPFKRGLQNFTRGRRHGRPGVPFPSSLRNSGGLNHLDHVTSVCWKGRSTVRSFRRPG